MPEPARAPREPDHGPRATVVIPNLDSPMIDATLSALREQSYDASTVEVLVVGLDGPGLVREDSLIRLVDTERPVPPAVARNIGIRQARGEIICFTDADCLPSRDWLTRLTAPYERPDVHVVAGGVTFPDDDYWTLVDALAHYAPWLTDTPPGNRDHLATLNFSARAAVFAEVGVFDEGFPSPAGEDTELTMRLKTRGYELTFAPDAVVFHAPRRQTLATVLSRACRFGQAAVHPALLPSTIPIRTLRCWPLLLATSPLQAAWVTWRVFARYPMLRRHWRAAPGVWLAKMAWRAGAASELRRQAGAAAGQ